MNAPSTMIVGILNNEINTKNDLISMAQTYSKDLKVDAVIDPYYFLLTLMTIESSFGAQNHPRFELGYSRSSIAYKKSEALKEGHDLWGDLAAMSYGPCQILWIVAKELGFSGHPLELWHGSVSMPYVVKLLNKLYAGGGNTVLLLAATYNAGLGCLKNSSRFPSEYVNKFNLVYQQSKEKYK